MVLTKDDKVVLSKEERTLTNLLKLIFKSPQSHVEVHKLVREKVDKNEQRETIL